MYRKRGRTPTIAAVYDPSMTFQSLNLNGFGKNSSNSFVSSAKRVSSFGHPQRKTRTGGKNIKSDTIAIKSIKKTTTIFKEFPKTSKGIRFSKSPNATKKKKGNARGNRKRILMKACTEEFVVAK